MCLCRCVCVGVCSCFGLSGVCVGVWVGVVLVGVLF